MIDVSSFVVDINRVERFPRCLLYCRERAAKEAVAVLTVAHSLGHGRARPCAREDGRSFRRQECVLRPCAHAHEDEEGSLYERPQLIGVAPGSPPSAAPPPVEPRYLNVGLRRATGRFYCCTCYE